jgi:O-antigen/teichoic acid export membrane protein
MPVGRSAWQLFSRKNMEGLKKGFRFQLSSLFSNAHSDRGKERYRRASLAASTSILSQVLAVIINIVSVPLTIRYLGQERYGVWLTISSLMTWMAMTDFGLTGTALINLISEAHGTENRVLAREYTSSTFWTLLAITLCMGIAFAAIFQWIPWQAVFRVSNATSARELRMACALAIGLFLLSLPLNMLNSIYNAYQDGVVANIWGIGANILALFGLIAVVSFRGGLPQLVLALSGTRALAGLANWCYLFFHRYPWLAPGLSEVHWHHIRRLLKLSGKYLISQISGMAIAQSQPIIITQILGPTYVPIFVVTYRIITIPQNLVYMATAPLVSAYGEAKARADWVWIAGALRNSTIGALVIGTAMVLVLAGVAKPLVRLWAGAGAVPSSGLVFWLIACTLILVATHPISQMLWGLERVNVPAVGLAISAVTTVKLSLEFGKRWGLEGIGAAVALSSLFYSLIQLYEVRRVLSQSRFHSPYPEPQASLKP